MKCLRLDVVVTFAHEFQTQVAILAGGEMGERKSMFIRDHVNNNDSKNNNNDNNNNKTAFLPHQAQLIH